MVQRRALALAAALLLPAAACTREIPSTASGPPDATAPPPAPAELSRFSVPLQYDFSSMLRVVERAVPSTFGSMDSIRTIGTDDRRHYAFEAARGPFTAFAEGSELHLRATVHYRVRGYYKPVLGPTVSAGCGGDSVRDRPRLVVELAAPLTLTPGWHLASRTRVVRIVPASTAARDHCDVTLLRRDLTPRVVDAARSALEARLPQIDRRVGEVDLRARFEEWWALLARPIQLAEGVWLVLAPERLRMGEVSGRERLLTVPVSLDARPRVVTSREAPALAAPRLPALAHDTVGMGFRIAMDGFVDYLTASRALDAALAGRTMVEAGRSLVIQRVAVSPATRGRLALTATLGGETRGTLRFVGTPAFDARSGMLAVPDLDYDFEAESRLLRTYAWLRSDALRATFRGRARFPASVALSRGRELLLQGLNRKLGDAVTLAATVDSVAVRGLYVTRDGLVVRADARGQASMTVQPR
jgi:hypothetical protein